MLIDEVVGWRAGLDDLLARFTHRFGRAEPHRQALTYLAGLLLPLASKNGWTLAEAAGDATPGRMQRLLNRSAWDQDAVRDDLFAYVSEHLGGRSSEKLNRLRSGQVVELQRWCAPERLTSY